MYKYYEHVDKGLEFEANIWMNLYVEFINDNENHADYVFCQGGVCNLDKEELRTVNEETLSKLLRDYDEEEIIEIIPETAFYFSRGKVYPRVVDRILSALDKSLCERKTL